MLKNKNEVQMKLSFMAITLIFIPTLVLSEDKKIAARIDKLIEHQPIFTQRKEKMVYILKQEVVLLIAIKGVSIEDNLYQYTPQTEIIITEKKKYYLIKLKKMMRVDMILPRSAWKTTKKTLFIILDFELTLMERFSTLSIVISNMDA